MITINGNTNDKELEYFQEEGVTRIGAVISVKNSCLAVSPGGSGKTVIMSSMAYRFIKKYDTDVVILVHSESLLEQTRDAIYEWYEVISQKVDSKTKFIPSGVRVFVIMVETFDRRTISLDFLEYFRNVGLLIIDEAHLNNFKKVFQFFPRAKRIGFTATPLSADKKDPLKNHYEDIVIIAQPSELLALNEIKPDRGIVPCIAWAPSNIKRDDVKRKKNGSFDEDDMGNKFSKPLQIKNTVDNYIIRAFGTKTICFNSNIEHSLKVTQAFIDEGFKNVRHLDGNKSGEWGNSSYKKDTLRWLKLTPDAILNNVGMVTTGFDEKSVETIILNSCIGSYPFFVQKTVRGSRPYRYPNGNYKKNFTLLDLGDNIVGGNHVLPTKDYPWEDVFWNPKLAGDGVGITKLCPICESMNPASARVCSGMELNWFTNQIEECLYVFPFEERKEDSREVKLIQVGDTIDVSANIAFFEDHFEFKSYNETIKQVANVYSKELSGGENGKNIQQEDLDVIFKVAQSKALEWFRLKGRRIFQNYKKIVADKVSDHLISLGLTLPEKEDSVKKLNFVENE